MPTSTQPPLSPDRLGRLTASLFGAALGLCPYLSRQALWRQLTGREAPFEGNEMTQWGTDHEAEALNAYECETGQLVRPGEFVPHEDWSGATPDGFVGKDGLIEVKCPYSRNIYEAWPIHYRAQVIGQLEIAQREWCDCFCWTPDGWKVVERIYANPFQFGKMRTELKMFYAHVIEDREPKRKARFVFDDEIALQA